MFILDPDFRPSWISDSGSWIQQEQKRGRGDFFVITFVVIEVSDPGSGSSTLVLPPVSQSKVLLNLGGVFIFAVLAQ